MLISRKSSRSSKKCPSHRCQNSSRTHRRIYSRIRSEGAIYPGPLAQTLDARIMGGIEMFQHRQALLGAATAFRHGVVPIAPSCATTWLRLPKSTTRGCCPRILPLPNVLTHLIVQMGLATALRSNHDRVFVPRLPNHMPWSVRGLSFASSNQQVIFERGVEIVAKKNSSYIFGCNPEASLATIHFLRNVSVLGWGARFLMHREQYADPKVCPHSEFRMGLEIRASSDISIHGLAVAESGGNTPPA